MSEKVSSVEDLSVLQRIGAGSFATVYISMEELAPSRSFIILGTQRSLKRSIGLYPQYTSAAIQVHSSDYLDLMLSAIQLLTHSTLILRLQPRPVTIAVIDPCSQLKRLDALGLRMLHTRWIVYSYCLWNLANLSVNFTILLLSKRLLHHPYVACILARLLILLRHPGSSTRRISPLISPAILPSLKPWTWLISRRS